MNHYQLAADEIVKTTEIEENILGNVVPQDKWIYEASAVHLAAKFMPRGLALLLKFFASDKLLEVKNMHLQTPLHIAARNDNSLSTR